VTPSNAPWSWRWFWSPERWRTLPSDLSTGAQDDLMKATEIVRAMVKSYGMSPELGAVSFEGGKRSAFLTGAPELATRDYSDESARTIDEEVRRLLDDQAARGNGIGRPLEPQGEHLLCLRALLRQLGEGPLLGRWPRTHTCELRRASGDSILPGG
jgi:hypothetical protein